MFKKEEQIGISVEDFWRKYATGKTGKFVVPVALPKVPGDENSPTVFDMAERDLEICTAELGNFIEEFVDHMLIPQRLRRPDWKDVYALYRYHLNKLVKWDFPRLG